MVASSRTITRLSAASGVPRGTNERMTRPLKQMKPQRWPTRDSELEIGHLAALIPGYAARVAADVIKPVMLAERIVCSGLAVRPESYRLHGYCSRTDAFFGPEDLAFPTTLTDYLKGAITRLADMTQRERDELHERLINADWSFTFCVDPLRVVIEWSEEAARCSLRWFQPETDTIRVHKTRRRVEWTATLPFGLLIAAAESWRDVGAGRIPKKVTPRRPK
jgi:hypothetical protein